MHETLPVIDFTSFPPQTRVLEHPSAAQIAVAKELDAVCRKHGFAVLRNAGVNPDEAFMRARELFSMSQEEKDQLTKVERAKGTNTGFFPLKSESLNSARACDDKEAFNLRNHSMSWHGTPPPFRPAAESFYSAAVDLAERVMEAAAIALGLPLDFFTSRHAKRDLCTLRFLHYPPLSEGSNRGAEATANENIRAGEHTDFGLITLLFVDAAGGADAAAGLQVRRPWGWLDVAAEPGDVIVNTGGLLAQWTNDEWTATEHRVVAAPAALLKPRYSIAYFTDPDSEVLVTVLEQFCKPEEGRPAKYAPITSLQYLLGKLAAAQLR